jgi:hypothetical protein
VTSDGERAFAFQQRVLARTSTRSRPLPWGTAYFHDDFPLRYDANMAIVDRSLAGASADDLAAALDEAYDGFGHREVEFASVADADSVAMGMAGHDYAAEHMVVMARRRAPDRAPDLAAVEEIGLDEMQPFTTEVTLREPWGVAPASRRRWRSSAGCSWTGSARASSRSASTGASRGRVSSTSKATSPRSRT